MNPAGGAKLALLTTLKMSIVGSITNSSPARFRSEEHTSELQSQSNLVSRPLLEKKRGVRGGGEGAHRICRHRSWKSGRGQTCPGGFRNPRGRLQGRPLRGEVPDPGRPELGGPPG